MQDDVQLIGTEAEPTAVIRHTLLRSEVRQNLVTPSVAEVLEVLAQQGLHPGGPVFIRHLTTDPYFFDFEIGVPVAATILSSGRVLASTLPASTVARVVHHGPHEGLARAWARLRDEIARAGLHPGHELWERHLKGPAESGDPGCWCTELCQPLLTAAEPGMRLPRDAAYPKVMPSLRPAGTADQNL